MIFVGRPVQALLVLFSVNLTLSLLFFRQNRLTYSQQASDKKGREEPDIDEPVPFSKSKAAQYDSVSSQLKGTRTNKPVFEPWIVRISLASFLVYFLFLREENDWDENFDLSGKGTFPELELAMLKNKQKAALSGGPSFTNEDQLRLKELENECKSL